MCVFSDGFRLVGLTSLYVAALQGPIMKSELPCVIVHKLMKMAPTMYLILCLYQHKPNKNHTETILKHVAFDRHSLVIRVYDMQRYQLRTVFNFMFSSTQTK